MAKPKTDQSVVRNQAYKKSEFSIRERHNERLNESYYNADIVVDRKHMNIHFREHFRVDDTGEVVKESYAETFNRLLADGTISVKGLKTDGSAKVFDELVFDVNTDYFDRNGGYSYAISFFEEAYRCAVKEIGGEEYVLSAVMHADEKNVALSEELGRDVYHYHLHVVYIPVVDKEVLWTKRCKDLALVGTVKETIKQVSHSKKWPRFKADGKWVNSYSLLQDRYHDHMKNAGFIGFERGERGSTAEHVSTEEYKARKERERAAEYAAIAEQKQNEVNYLSVVAIEKQEEADQLDTDIAKKTKSSATLDKTVEKEQKRLTELQAKIAAEEKLVIEYEEIEKLGHKRGITGSVTVSGKMWTKILNLVKEALNSRNTIKNLNTEIKELKSDVKNATTALEKQKSAYAQLVNHVQPYLDAVKMFPLQVKETISQYLDMGRKQREQARLEQLQREQAAREQQKLHETQAPKRKRNDFEL
jgi:hypothetical protein